MAFYYYLMPFFILIFQTFLLYAGEIYTQYKKSNADKDAAAAAAALLGGA